MNKLNTKLLIGYILLGALIIAVAREYGFFAFVILVGFLVFVLVEEGQGLLSFKQLTMAN